MCFWQTTKSAVGRLRPDFLARCKPKGAENYTFHLQYGTYTYQDCSEANQYILDDGRSSFPSGASSLSATSFNPPLHHIYKYLHGSGCVSPNDLTSLSGFQHAHYVTALYETARLE